MDSPEAFVPSNPGRLLLNHPGSPARSLCIFLRRPELSLASCHVLLPGAPEVLQADP